MSLEDDHLFCVTDDVQTAVDEVLGFYRNYHSQRFVKGRLVLRMQEAPSPERLAALNEEFADIVVRGEMEIVGGDARGDRRRRPRRPRPRSRSASIATAGHACAC